MNIYYLKRFRKEARKTIKITAQYDIDYVIVYSIIKIYSQFCQSYLYDSKYITDAICALRKERAEYVRRLLRDQKIKKLNKSLSQYESNA